jgi:drug/metabolite transporter (DMT)-like permease
MLRAMDKPQQRSMNATEWALLLLLATLWGGSFFFGKMALAVFPALTLVALRTGLAALALLLFLALRGIALPLSLAAWGRFLVMGLLNNALPFALINWGQTQIDSGLAAILNATTPLFTVLLAHLVTADERLTRNRIAGVALGFAGVVVMIGPSALRGLGLAGLGKLAVVGAACAYACAGLYGRRLAGLPPVAAASPDCRRSPPPAACWSPLRWSCWLSRSSSTGRKDSQAGSLPARRSGFRSPASPSSARRSPISSISVSWRQPARPISSSSPFSSR